MDAILKEHSAKEILEPYLEIIQNIYLESLADLNTVLIATTQTFNKRNRSGIIHNFAINLTKKYLGEDPNITLIEKYSSIQIVFNNATPLVARYKKINKRKLSSNVSTIRSNSINNQISLFPMDVTYIDFGYRMNDTNTEFETLKVVCRVGNNIVWDFDINGAADALKTVTKEKVDATTREKETQLKLKG